MSLDPDCKIPAYLLGRLMAVMERAQYVAMKPSEASEKWTGASIVDKAYGAASATPATIMCRLLRGVRHHLSKVKKEKPGLARWYEDLLNEICNNFAAPETAFPSSLSLQEQGLFSLGYYQQRADLFKRKEASLEASAAPSQA